MAYNFIYENTYLQGDNIVVTIDPASDITSTTGRAKEYQYKIDSYFLQNNGEHNTSIDSSTGWKIIALDGASQGKIVVPSLDYDAYNTIYLRAADDAKPEYISIGQKDFYSFKQKIPQFLLNEVTENSATATISDLGFGYPQNGASIDYIKKVAEAFTKGDFEWTITLRCAGNENAIKNDDRDGLANAIIDLKNYSTNTLNFSFTQEGFQSTNLYFACEITSTLDRAADDRNYVFAKGFKQYTNIYFVSANTVSFQVRSRSVRAQMPKVDEIGSASTGAGMFSNSNAIGYKDNSDSIALYSSKSTRAEQPSIGFYKTDHTKIADIYTKENGSIYGKMVNGNEVDLLNPVVKNVENAATADKLTNKRTIRLIGGAQGQQIFDGSTNIDIPINSLDESYLTWGNNNSISGKASPIGAALSSELSANRLAYLKPEALKMEYSNDGGSTWEEASWADSAKIGLVTTSSSITIGSESTVTTNHRTRVTLTAQDGTTRPGYFYTRPRKLLVNVSSCNHGLEVMIESKTGASDAEWKTLGTYTLSGWSGWNDISMSALSTLGGDSITQTSNNWYIRFTFAVTSVNSSYKTSKATVLGMRLFGDSCWTGTSNMGKTGHLYSYDIDQNAEFPAKVTAESFEGALSADAVKKALGVTTGTTKFLREDGTWAIPSTGGSVDLNGYAKYGAAVSSRPANYLLTFDTSGDIVPATLSISSLVTTGNIDNLLTDYAKTADLGTAAYKDVAIAIVANSLDVPTCAAVAGYLTTNGYLTKTLADTYYAKIADLSSYAKTSDLSAYAKTADLGTAARKGVDTTISTIATPTDNNVPTSKAVASYLTAMGYLTLTNAVNHGVLTNTNLGYSENGKNYPVEKDSNGKLYVNVPWIAGETNLSAYATQSWVEGKGYLTSTGVEAILSTKSYVVQAALAGYVTTTAFTNTLNNYIKTSDFNALVDRVAALEAIPNANGKSF